MVSRVTNIFQNFYRFNLKEFDPFERVKQIGFQIGVCCPLLVFSCAGLGVFVRKTKRISLQGPRGSTC